MDTGLKVSLGGHAVLLAVALVGWPFASSRDAAPPESVSVTIVSASDLPAVGGLTPPSAPDFGDTVAALSAPAAETAPERPEPQPDTAPDAVVTPEPPAPEAPPPPPVDRVAPVPQPAPPEPVREADRVQPAIEQSPDPAPQTTATEEQEATAPEAAAPQIVTEATDTSEALTEAPAPVPRPMARPNRPAPVVAETPQTSPDEPPVAETPPDQTPPPDPVEDAIAAALAEALSAPETTPAPQAQSGGPPLSQGERDGLRVAVSRCWNFGALSTDAAKVTVVVGMDMALDGSPSNLRLVSETGGSAGAAQQAFDTARRAILRCAPFSLPAEKYDQWRSIEMTFNPEEMRRR